MLGRGNAQDSIWEGRDTRAGVLGVAYPHGLALADGDHAGAHTREDLPARDGHRTNGRDATKDAPDLASPAYELMDELNRTPDLDDPHVLMLDELRTRPVPPEECTRV